jgi:hypothetical protein
MGAIESNRRFYEENVAGLIHTRFREYEERIAVGIAGEGSDCFGYDDLILRDHDHFYVSVKPKTCLCEKEKGMENELKQRRISPMAKTWILDLDGTLVVHDGPFIRGRDEFLPGAREFLESIPKRDMIIYNHQKLKRRRCHEHTA